MIFNTCGGVTYSSDEQLENAKVRTHTTQKEQPIILIRFYKTFYTSTYLDRVAFYRFDTYPFLINIQYNFYFHFSKKDYHRSVAIFPYHIHMKRCMECLNISYRCHCLLYYRQKGKTQSTKCKKKHKDSVAVKNL